MGAQARREERVGVGVEVECPFDGGVDDIAPEGGVLSLDVDILNDFRIERLSRELIN